MGRFEPFKKFWPQKPKLLFFTEFASAKELYENWAKKRFDKGEAVQTEKKLNGYRGIVEKKGKEVRLWFEDAKHSYIDKHGYEDIKKVLEGIPDDFILDASIGIERGGKPLPRIKLATLLANVPELKSNDVVLVSVFDIMYWKESVGEKPFEERRKLLEEFYSKFLKGSKNFEITRKRIVHNYDELKSAVRWAAEQEGSEGAMAKDLTADYSLKGGTDALAKTKTALEVKVLVLDKIETKKKGTYNYVVGLGL